MARGPATRTPLYRHVCFTINNPTEDPNDFLSLLSLHCRYAVFQLERGRNGTDHFQGYMVMLKQTRNSWLINNIAIGHYEKMLGSPQQASDYCKKGDTRIAGPWEFGDVPKGQGARSDIAQLFQAAKKGNDDRFLFINHTNAMMRYYKAVDRVRAAFCVGPKLRPYPREVFLQFGPPGLGKSRSVYQDEPLEKNLFTMPKTNSCWFTGYSGQRTIVLDDFAGAASHMRLDCLLDLLEPWTNADVAKHYGVTRITADTIIINTNIHPRNWYDFSTRQSLYDALKRRISCLLIYKKDLTAPNGRTIEYITDFN